MTRRKRTSSREAAPANEGIIVHGGDVTGEMITVGPNARVKRIVQQGNDQADQLRLAVEQLRAALDRSLPDPAAREVVQSDVTALEQAIKHDTAGPEKPQDILTRIVARVQQLGTLATTATGLWEPIAKVASLLGLSLRFPGSP